MGYVDKGEPALGLAVLLLFVAATEQTLQA